MSKVALITDQHYGIKSDSPLFYDYYKKSNDLFFSILEEEGITRIVHLGDLFDRRKYINFVTASRCRKDFLDIVDARGYAMDIIAGNHDVFYKNTNEINSLNELVKYDGIAIHISPTEIEIDGVKILLMPWIPSSEDDINFALSSIKETTAQICFGHLDLNGFEMSKGIKQDHGFDASIFDKFDVVCSGHFHHRSSRGNIHYIGAAYEQTWSDWNDPRGFTIFDTATRDLKFIQNPYSIFHMINYSEDTDYSSQDFSSYKDSFVRVVILKKNDLYKFDMFMDKLLKAGPADISLIEDMTSLDVSDEEEIDQTENTLLTLHKYVDSQTSPLDPIKTKQLLTSIYNEAISMEDSSDTIS